MVGIGNALIDVGGFTLLARLADETVLARMFAGFEAILTLGVAAGGLLAPVVIDLLGVRLALVAVGVLAPAGRRRQLARAAPARRAGCACATPTSRSCAASAMLGALPAATIEQLGAGLKHAEFAPRETVFEQGEHGDRFYVVESGRAEVVRGGRVVDDARARRLLRRDRAAERRAADGHDPRRRGRAAARERPAAPRVPDRGDRLPGQRGGGPGGRDPAQGARCRAARRRATRERSRRRRGATRPSGPQHVGQAAAEDAKRLTEAPEPGGSGNRIEGPGEVADLHEVRLHGPDALEVLRDLMHRRARAGRATAAVGVLGEQDVLGRLHRVLEQAMDEDHVDADELSPALDLLGRDLADVRDELQLQPLVCEQLSQGTGSARPAAAPVEGAVHGDHGLGDGGEVRAIGASASRERKAASPSISIRSKPGAASTTFVSRRAVAASACPSRTRWELHVLGVAADVGDQQQRARGLHWVTLTGETT